MPVTRFLVMFSFIRGFLVNGNCFRIQGIIKIKGNNGKKGAIYASENMAILNSSLVFQGFNIVGIICTHLFHLQCFNLRN